MENLSNLVKIYLFVCDEYEKSLKWCSLCLIVQTVFISQLIIAIVSRNEDFYCALLPLISFIILGITVGVTVYRNFLFTVSHGSQDTQCMYWGVYN